MPNAVILDGSLTFSGTKYQKTCNALDAMAQAIESAWANQSTDESIKYSIESIELGWNVINNFIEPSCSSIEAQKMIEASNLAVDISFTRAEASSKEYNFLKSTLALASFCFLVIRAIARN